MAGCSRRVMDSFILAALFQTHFTLQPGISAVKVYKESCWYIVAIVLQNCNIPFCPLILKMSLRLFAMFYYLLLIKAYLRITL